MKKEILYRYINAFVAKLDNACVEQEKKSDMSFVAMFHNVVNTSNALGNDAFAITTDNLRCFLSLCSNLGYDIVSIDDLLEMRREDALHKKAVITFDDGFESLYTIVNPLFKEKNIPYTAFITTGFLDQPGYLTQAQVKELSESRNCTIGMHADQHVLYRYETDDFLREDYLRCRDRITAVTGTVPVHYAFPYGSLYACSMHNCCVVKDLGARTVFVTRQLKLRNRDLKSCCYIPRLNIPGYYNNTVSEKYRRIEI